MINIKEFFEYLVSIGKIFTFDKRIDKLEKELAKALDKANNNKLHCPQCGGDVKINYALTADAGKTMYNCNCKNCDFKGIITK